MSRKRTAVLISGRGSNMGALISAAMAPSYPAEIALVISNRADAKGLERAEEFGIATAVVDHTGFSGDREAFEKAVDKGNLSDRASTLLFLSRALYELDEFEAARSAARQAADAADSDSSRNAASNYLTLIDSTEQRYNIIEQRKADAIDFYEPYPSLID